MPPKTSLEHAQISTDIKSGKTRIRNIMDDAPLFAGLDDFVLNQAERMKAEHPQAVQQKEKKKSASRRSKQITSADPMPQPAPKVQKAQPPDPNAILLSVAETCTLLKISRATLIRMDTSGKLPGRIKLGGSVRFHRETVESWLQSLITYPTP